MIRFAMAVPAGMALLAALGTSTAARDYVVLDESGQPLRAAFNAADGKVRILAYVAPTCGGCLRGVDAVQKHVLSELDSPDLEVYVVWAKKNGAAERHVERVTRLMPDPRATQYWDEHRVVLRALDELLGIPARACAGAFLVYGPGARWEADPPPQPASWFDAHAREFEDHGPAFDAERVLEEVRRLL